MSGDADWRSSYEADGYVVLEGVLGADELEQVRAALATLLETGPRTTGQPR